MTWRDLLSSAFTDQIVICQDHELQSYINENNLLLAYGYNADYFKKYIQIVDYKSTFGICIINERFTFHDLVNKINNILKNYIQNKGILYLSINKFLAQPESIFPYTDDYDLALRDFVKDNINGTVLSYNYKADDDGSYFNFVHPLNRFYIQNENSEYH